MSVPDEKVIYVEDKGKVVFEPPFRIKHSGKTKLHFPKMKGGNTFIKASFEIEEAKKKTIDFMEYDLTRLVLQVTIKAEYSAKLDESNPTPAMQPMEPCCLWCDNVLYCSSEFFCIACEGMFICCQDTMP